MPRLIVCALASVMVAVAPSSALPQERTASAEELTLGVMTFNIRYDTPEDGIHAWPHRRDALAAFVDSLAPDVLCIQEGLDRQVRDLEKRLCGYSWRGVGRDDGATGGEYCAIFFNSRRFRCEGDSTVWLSPSPALPSRGWDAALPRIVTWVELRERPSGTRVNIFNTHFDHLGIEARRESAAFVRGLVERESKGLPAILAGDFNCEETEEPYAILTSSGRLRDARTIAPGGPTGPQGTFCGFPLTEEIEGPRIDFLFVTEVIAVSRHETLRAVRPAGFLSDHCPVTAILTVPR